MSVRGGGRVAVIAPRPGQIRAQTSGRNELGKSAGARRDGVRAGCGPGCAQVPGPEPARPACPPPLTVAEVTMASV